MPVSVKGSGGGGVTLDAGAAASDTTLTLPNVSGTVLQSGTAVTVAQGGTGVTSLTSGSVLVGAGTSAVTSVAPTTAGNVLFTTNGTSWSSTAKIVLGTAVASTSGASIDFTGIPSWAKRVTINMAGISTTGTSPYLIQLGTSSGVETTGYSGNNHFVGTGASAPGATAALSSGFLLTVDTTRTTAASVYFGSLVLSLVSTNFWLGSGVATSTAVSGAMFGVAGSKTVAAALDRVRITTVGGTDTFDAGTINIMYE